MIKEKEFQQSIIDLAKATGWYVYHTYDSRRCTPGFPDLVLIKPPTLLFREIKTETGRLTDAQKKWLSMLDESGLNASIWRPTNWPEIEETLKEGKSKNTV